jgi:hypothetical protein
MLRLRSILLRDIWRVRYFLIVDARRLLAWAGDLAMSSALSRTAWILSI